MNLLFIDTETGGTDPRRHTLLQVAAVAYKDGKILGQLQFNNRVTHYTTTEEAMKINGLDLQDVYNTGVTPSDGVQMLNNFIKRHFGDEKPILAGHNVSFDKYFIQYQLYENNGLNINDFISYRMLDTMSLLWGLHFAGKVPKEACSSSGAFKYFGIEVEGRHTALGDCLATVKLFEKLIGLIKGNTENVQKALERIEGLLDYAARKFEEASKGRTRDEWSISLSEFEIRRRAIDGVLTVEKAKEELVNVKNQLSGVGGNGRSEN